MTDLEPLAPFRLDGKVAIVTGASSGLGARFARVLDAAGARVMLAARRLDRLEALAGELTDAAAHRANLADPGVPGRLVAPFALAQHAARSMTESERGGVVVNIASV